MSRADRGGASLLSNARTFYLIWRADLIIYQRLDKILRPTRLTVAQYTVMSILGRRGWSSSAQLSRRVGVSPQTMFRVISELERRKLVRRRSDEGDRRALGISLTQKGARLLASCERRVASLEAEMFRSFTPAQLGRFRGDLLRLVPAAR